MADISLAATLAKIVSIGSTQVQKVSIGATLIWQNFVPMGVNKSGTFAQGRNTWETITAWVARSGYGSTNVTTNGFTSVTSSNATITGQLTYGGSGNTQARLVVDGTIVATGAVAAGSNPATVSWTGAVDNATVAIQGTTDSIGSTARTIQAGSGTFIQMDAA